MDADQITVTLDANQALVLFDLLARWEGDKHSARPTDECFENVAEVRALVDLFQKLDGELVDTLSAVRDYEQAVSEARERVADGPGVQLLGPWRNDS
ncbi:hypothetical protein EWE75_23820 [Sphingomonas populi]|uniref:Uncharacterized protein n=1 Tax=Sphingomonas populi TaxID=2484750 RepID=A0A4V2DBT0_9SPHN|nr:hypothetical protein [Sphingomonas populi]RZF59058.1 hypothetical protein EWE75_23820 [Sphingomonas populi]